MTYRSVAGIAFAVLALASIPASAQDDQKELPYGAQLAYNRVITALNQVTDRIQSAKRSGQVPPARVAELMGQVDALRKEIDGDNWADVGAPDYPNPNHLIDRVDQIKRELYRGRTVNLAPH